MNLKSLPDWAKSFVVDFLGTGLVIVLGLNLVIPNTLDEAKAQAAIVGMGIFGAFVNAARRNKDRFMEWVKAQIGYVASAVQR